MQVTEGEPIVVTTVPAVITLETEQEIADAKTFLLTASTAPGAPGALASSIRNALMTLGS